MREYMGGKEIIHLGITRFASNFIALKSLADAKTPLKRMFVSEWWMRSPFLHKKDGERVVKIVFDDFFWKCVHEVMKII